MQALCPMIYFQTAADEAMAIPVANIDAIDINAATEITITATKNFVQYKAVLNIDTAGQEEAALKAIVLAINGGPHSDGLIIIADDENSVYCTPEITSCGALSQDIAHPS